MNNRLEYLRSKIDTLIYETLTADDSRYYITHLYGVSQFCALLAIRRGLNAEIAATSGMLHDIYQVTDGIMEKHAKKGAEKAKLILENTGMYTDEEIDVITTAVSRHGKKRKVHRPYDEVLKDADVLAHCLYNPDYPVIEKEEIRYANLLLELGSGKEEIIL